MLTELKIENIALVDRTELAFEPGMSVLTGETGAGKSIIVTALALALGGRGEREYIRHGCKSAVVEAVFDISPMPPAFRKEHEEWLDGDRVRIRRSLSSDGNSRVSINGRRSTLAHLRQITAPLGEILGQHATQMLMNEDNHLLFLDRFAGLREKTDLVGTLYNLWRTAADDLRRLRARREQLIQERELLLFQREEIDRAHLRVGEERELLDERKILDAARSLMASSALVEDTLGGDGNSVSLLLATVRKELESMAAIDHGLEEQNRELYDLTLRLEDLRRTIELYGSSIVDDPARVEEVNIRLDEIYKLKKKYGGSEETVLETLTEINERLKTRRDTDSAIAELEAEHERCYQKYKDAALDLSARRAKASRRLEKMVVTELGELAIDQARFTIEFIREEIEDGVILDGRSVRPTEHGLESVRFLFSANPGEPPRSLVKTASGGELSRVLLALKSAEQKQHKLSPTLMVFDEVDAGIGGSVAVEVGRKLRALAADRQVIVITHLHQIARQADSHYVVEKVAGDSKRNIVSVMRLESEGIDTELDRMLALPDR